MRLFGSGAALAVLLLVCSADAQTGTRTVRSTADVLYTLRLSATATERLPANAHAVAFDARGRLFVLDRSDGLVWVFGAGGALERRLALGEAARNALHMTLTGEGRLVFTDPARGALLVVDPALPAEARQHPLGGGVPSGALLPHPREGVVVQMRSLPDVTSGSWSRDVQFRWYPLNGRPATTVRSVSPSADARSGAPGASSMPLVAVLPSGVAVAADPRRYRVELFTQGRSRVLERSVAPRAITPADRSWLAARSACAPVRLVGGADPADPAMLAGFRSPASEQHPEQVSAISRMAWSPAGQLWIERPGARLDHAGSVDVYTADGTFLGALQGIGVPDAWAPDGRTAAYVARGPDCRTTVTVRRITTTAAP